MKAGDLVSIYTRNRWGGLSARSLPGILLKRVYLGYDKNESQWEILTSKGRVVLKEKNLKVKE